PQEATLQACRPSAIVPEEEHGTASSIHPPTTSSASSTTRTSRAPSSSRRPASDRRKSLGKPRMGCSPLLTCAQSFLREVVAPQCSPDPRPPHSPKQMWYASR